MDSNGLNQEQQALLASIMGKSPQAGGGTFTAAAANPSPSPAPASAPAAAPTPANSGRLLSQAEIDALIASMQA